VAAGIFEPSDVADNILDASSPMGDQRKRLIQEHGSSPAERQAVGTGGVRVGLDIQHPFAVLDLREGRIMVLFIQFGEFLKNPLPAGCQSALFAEMENNMDAACPFVGNLEMAAILRIAQEITSSTLARQLLAGAPG
jgi:hypothetical protein